MVRLPIRTVVLGSVLTAALAGLLPAQVQIGPLVGAYYATRNVIEQSDGTSAKQATSVALGARISAATQNKIGFDGSITYVPSDVTATNGASGGSADLLLLSARGLMAFGAAESRTRFYLAAGPAIIVRNGEFYADFDGTTDFGGDVAVGVRLALGKVVGRVEVESYLYAVNLKGAGGLSTGSELQADIVASATIAIPLGP